MPRRAVLVVSICVALAAIPGILSAYMLWSGIYQVNPAFDEWFRGAAPVLGGDWVVVGTMGSNPPSVPTEIRITRIDETGSVRWDKHVTGGVQAPDGPKVARGVAASPDGGCVTVAEIAVAGGIGGVDVLVTKWRSNGTVEWHRLIGTVAGEYRFYIAPATGGGYFVSGLSLLDDFNWMHVVKFTEDGTPLWQKRFGNADALVSSIGYSPLASTADGGCVLLAWRNYPPYGLPHYNLVVKFESDGTVEWMREIGGGNKDYLRSVSQDPRGGYILVGETDTFGPNKDIDQLWLLRLDASGLIDWQKAIVMTDGGSVDTRGYGAVGIDDGYLVTASAALNSWFVRTHLNGDIVWRRTYRFGWPTVAVDIVLGPGDTFVGIGRDYRNGFGSDDRKSGWFLRAPISTGIVGTGCPVFDTGSIEDSSGENILEFDFVTAVEDGLLGIDYNPSVDVFNVTSTPGIACSEFNPEEYVMADRFESGDFSGWSYVFP